jgi:hypothetical protein
MTDAQAERMAALLAQQPPIEPLTSDTYEFRQPRFERQFFTMDPPNPVLFNKKSSLDYEEPTIATVEQTDAFFAIFGMRRE